MCALVPSVARAGSRNLPHRGVRTLRGNLKLARKRYRPGISRIKCGCCRFTRSVLCNAWAKCPPKLGWAGLQLLTHNQFHQLNLCLIPILARVIAVPVARFIDLVGAESYRVVRKCTHRVVGAWLVGRHKSLIIWILLIRQFNSIRCSAKRKELQNG